MRELDQPEFKAYVYNEAEYFQKLFCVEPILITTERPLVVEPKKQVCYPIEKMVGLLGIKYSLCHIYVDKNFYEWG